MNMSRKLAAIALLLFTASFADAAIVKHWSAGGTSTNMNWNLGANWDDLAAPISISQVYFENLSEPNAPTNVVGAINNIVSPGTVVQQANYNAFWVYFSGGDGQNGVSNPPSCYGTYIPSGVTLTLSNTTAGGVNKPVFTAGDFPDSGNYFSSTGPWSYTTITGPGSISVIAPKSFIFQGGKADAQGMSSCDMSGLANLNASVSMLRVGALNERVNPDGQTNFSYTGTLWLPQTNNVTALGWSGGSGPGVLIGCDQSVSAGNQSTFGTQGPVMVLGISNVFNTVGFTVGGAGAYNAACLWTNAPYNPANYIKIRGTNGTSPVPVLSVGDYSADVTSYSPAWRVLSGQVFGGINSSRDALDLSGGYADIAADAIYIGRSSPSNTPSGFAGNSAYPIYGVALFANGVVTTTNLYLGHKILGGTNQTAPSGYLRLDSTKMTVYNNLFWLDRTNAATGGATLYLTNGAVMDVRGNLVQGLGNSGGIVSGLASIYADGSTNYFGGMIVTNQNFTVVVTNGGLVNVSNSILGYANETVFLGSSFDGSKVSTMYVNGDVTVGQLTGDGNFNSMGTLTISNKNNGINPGLVSGQKATLSIGNNLNLANVTNLTFDLSGATTVGSGVNDYISVPGLLSYKTSGAPMTLQLNYSNGLATGTYVLMSYGSTNGGLQPTNLFPFITRATIYVTNDNAAKQLQLVATNFNNCQQLYWVGVGTNANGINWTIGTNFPFVGAPMFWTNPATSGADVFKQFDAAVFDEAVMRTNQVKATQPILIGSGGMTFNITNTTFTNVSGSLIYGQGGLTRNGLNGGGSGWLTLANANDFFGPVSLKGGLTILGSANAFGTTASQTGTVAIASGAALAFGAATAIGAIGSGSGTANPKFTELGRIYTIGGTGVGNNAGVIFATNLANNAYKIINAGINLSDDALVTCSNQTTSPNMSSASLGFYGIPNVGVNIISNNWGVSPAILDLKGKTLTINSVASNLLQTSVGSFTQTNPFIILGMKIADSVGNGGINLASGTLWLGGSDGAGAAFVDSSAKITMANNTILRLSGFSYAQGSTGYVNSSFILNSNAMFMRTDRQTDSGFFPIQFGNTIAINNGGTLTVSNYSPSILALTTDQSANYPNQAMIALNGQITGPGASLVKGGVGRLWLGATETYTGPTYINDGILMVSNNMKFASSLLYFNQYQTGSTNNWLDTSGSPNGLVLTQPFVPPNLINGSLVVSNGCVMGNGALSTTINGNLTVDNNGQITPGTTFDTGTIIVTNDLVLSGDGSNTNFFMNIGPSTNKSDQIYVKGNLVMSNNTLNIFNVDTLGGFSPNGTNILIQYTGSLIGGGGLANITNINPTSRFYVHFVDPTTTTNVGGGGYLAVYLATNPASLTWKGWDNAGGNTNWNVKAATNWSNGGNPDKFYNGDRVTFDDSASTSTIYITNTVGPDTMTFTNNSLTYTLTGPGIILAGSLTNNGSGGVVIANSAANNYWVGLGLYTASGKTTTFQQPTNSTLTGDLVGPGTIVMAGTNMLTVNAQDPNTFTGNFTVSSGILRPGLNSVTNAFGNVNGLPTITVSGGVFDLNGSVGDKEKIGATGAGPVLSVVTNTTIYEYPNGFDGFGNQLYVQYFTNTCVVTNQLGAIDNRGAMQSRAFTYVSLNGDTVLGAISNTWYITTIDPNGLAAGSFLGNSKNLTKIGSYDLWIQNGADIGVSNIVVAPNSGKLIFAEPSYALNTQLGLTSGTITVCSNSMVGFANGINANAKPMIVQPGGAIFTSGYSNTYAGNITISNGVSFLAGIADSGQNGIGGRVTPTNVATAGTNCFVYTDPNAQLLLSGNISGPGTLTVDSIGSLSNYFGTEGLVALNGSNSYSGGTVIKEGTLQIGSSNALVQNTNIVLYGHVTANVSGWPRLMVVSNVITPANVGALMYVDSDGSYAQLQGYLNNYGNWGACEIGGDGATWNGPIIIQGSPTNTTSCSPKSVVSIRTGTNGFTINGAINGSAFRGSTAPFVTYVVNGVTNGANGGFNLSGTSANPTNGAGPAITFNGPLNINGSVLALDWFADTTMTKVILATNGNNWDFLVWYRGLMQFGADNALPIAPIQFGHGFPGGDHRTIFDLNGHSESFSWLFGSVGDEGCWIGNSSTVSDARINYVGYSTNTTGGGSLTQTNIWNYFIVDSLLTNATTKKTLVNVTGGYLQLSAPDAAGGWTDPNNYASGAPAFSMIPYTGATTVSGGTLDVAENLQSASITVTGSGILRGLGSSVGPVVVTSGGTLAPGSGLGLIPNPVVAGASNTIVTNTIGTFTVSNNVTFAATGNGVFNVDNDYHVNDQLVSIGGMITYGGTLMVNNTTASGQPFLNTQAIPLFSATNYSGTVPTVYPVVPASNLVWNTSTLMTDGMLRVSQVSIVPPVITRTVSGSGPSATMTMSWPQDHGGYRLQTQTNALNVGLKTTGWVDVPNSTNVLSITVPITNTPTVFYRLVYP
jgi:autotransporter-associated beta strand protein